MKEKKKIRNHSHHAWFIFSISVHRPSQPTNLPPPLLFFVSEWFIDAIPYSSFQQAKVITFVRTVTNFLVLWLGSTRDILCPPIEFCRTSGANPLTRPSQENRDNYNSHYHVIFIKKN